MAIIDTTLNKLKYNGFGHYVGPGAGVEVNLSDWEVTTSYGTQGTPPSVNLPLASVGIPVPFIIGRQRVMQPNVIWYGNLQEIKETTETIETTYEENVPERGASGEIEATETVTTTVKTVGYLVDGFFGVCLGPDVVLKAIYVDNVAVWEGTAGPERTVIAIPAGDTFISGSTIIWHGGANDQAPDPEYVGLIEDLPGYVGIAYIICQALTASVPFGALSFEVERFPNPLSLPSGQNRIGDDVNAASMLAEVMTNPWGGGGLGIEYLDTDEFEAVADTLTNESNAGSMILLQESSVVQLIDIVQRQMSSIVFHNPSTGLIQVKLTRQDEFGYFNARKLANNLNVLDVRDFEKSGWQDTVEQLRGDYIERTKDYSGASVFAQNFSNLSYSGRGKRTSTINYPTVMNANLAVDLLTRDLADISAPIFYCTIVTNRDGAELIPGDFITLTWPQFNLLSVPMLVNKVRKSPINQNTIVITARQLLLPSRAAVYAAPITNFVPDTNMDPIAPSEVRFITAPYFVARKANPDVGKSVAVYPIILPKPANNAQSSFNSYVENVPNSSQEVMYTINSLYPTSAELNMNIDQYDAIDDGIIDEVYINTVVNDDNLLNIANSGVRSGRILMFIGNEIMSFESVANTGFNAFTLYNVHRALLDTAPQSHTAGTEIFIIGNNYSMVAAKGFSYPLGYLPDWLITSNNASTYGKLDDALESDDWVPAVNRTVLPLRPHNTKIDGVRSATPFDLDIGEDYEITWRTRFRGALDVKLQLDAAEGGEVGQYHTVFLIDGNNVTRNLGSTPDDDNYNSLIVTIPANANPGAGRLYVRAVSPNGNSLYNDYLPVNIVSPPPSPASPGDLSPISPMSPLSPVSPMSPISP